MAVIGYGSMVGCCIKNFLRFKTIIKYSHVCCFDLTYPVKYLLYTDVNHVTICPAQTFAVKSSQNNQVMDVDSDHALSL